MAILGLLLFSACSSEDRQTVDWLNTLSYACHYRNIDSTEHYARRAFLLSDCDDGKAEALNNLAFVSIIRMDYQKAAAQLDSALALTDNQLELLVSHIQHMRLCQRRSMNRQFYEYREQAVNALKRINEERERLSDHQRQRLLYAESEMAIVTSTYYYYVGLERQSREALEQLNIDELHHDTAQYLNYLYNVGAGGVLTEGTPDQIEQEEVDMLHRCMTVAERHGYIYFVAQAKEGLAEHTGDLQLADESLLLFQQYGDVYQIAGAYRTLATCCHAVGDDEQALYYLHKALADSTVNQAPDLVASIREQLSVAYAAVDDKSASDYNRNQYLDLQEQTRQDRELEARAGLLDKAVGQLNVMLWAVVGAIVLLVFLLWLFNWLNRRRKDDDQLDDVLEQKNDELRMRRMSVEKSERLHVEQRAKVSLVNSITPFIDRILYTIDHLPMTIDHARDEGVVSGQLDYIRELTDKINEQNDLLTQWIQLRQGELRLHIESFPLQPLFDMVGRGRTTFEMNGVELRVEPTEATVKADRVLTLFMLNTLADNARKFTPKGGHVVIAAQEADNYVEVSVTDTGRGMSEAELSSIFDHKIVAGHGFGLMNCKGIIEKYRKMSQLFSVCQLSAESRQGHGSRFFFRLPKGVRRMVLLLLFALPAMASASVHDYKTRAHIYADSAFFSNINGTYVRTLQFADSCRKYLNLQYQRQRPKGHLLMMAEGDTSQPVAEIQWYHDGIDANYQVILDIRNESAVAALALHEWNLYAYNNKVYTQLFKELSADSTLGDYCRTMQQSQSNKRIAVILLIVILLLIVPAYYLLYYRHRLYNRHRRESMQLASIEMVDDELRRAEFENAKLHVVNAVLDNCLSTLKHETMYYPSRIRQLVDKGDTRSLGEVTRYYRDIYGILSEQAMRQVELVKTHVAKTELYGQVVLGDANMLHYLFDILKPADVTAQPKDDRYVVCTVHRQQPLSDIDYLLCRQILRDHGDATHRRGCGITIEDKTIYITLPRYNGKL